MTAVLGCDPGASGGLARLDSDGLHVVDMPMCGKLLDPIALRDLLIAWGPVDRVAVEQVRPFRGSSPMGTFNFGGVYYGLLAVLAVLERPTVHVTPTVWTKHFAVGDDKAAHVQRATERFPSSAAEFRGPRGGALDGRADAALIALWCAETSVGVGV